MQPSIGILLRELARLYTQAQREHVTSGHDTSSTQSHVLMELGRAGLLTQHELGRRLSLDKGWVSRAVESLVQAGLVAKSRSDNDRRSRWLQLTPQGSTRYQALNASLDAHAEQLMQPLAAEQRVSIHEALVLLISGLQRAVPQEFNPEQEASRQEIPARPVMEPAPVIETADNESMPVASSAPEALAEVDTADAENMTVAHLVPVEATETTATTDDVADADGPHVRNVIAAIAAACAEDHDTSLSPLAMEAVAAIATACAEDHEASVLATDTAIAAASAPPDDALAARDIPAETVHPAPAQAKPAMVPALVAKPAMVHAPTLKPTGTVPRPPAWGATPATDTHAHATRAGQPTPPTTRILGSKTLPTRPLLSHQTPRTPLSRAAQSAEQRNSAAAASGAPARNPHNATTSAPSHSTGAHHLPHTPQHSATPAARVHTPALQQSPSRAPAMPSQQPPVRVQAAPAAKSSAPSPATDSRPHESIFHKLLSQSSLFNKLLQRNEPPPPEEPAEEPAPVEIEPVDHIMFQPAAPSDWTEIRNLLTACRLPLQGAVNHLHNFIVATENGRVVGAIGLEIYGDVGLVRSLAVASSMRGRSIAKRLVRQMVEYARGKRLKALYLPTCTADLLFERYGFEKLARADMPSKLSASPELTSPAAATATTGMVRTLL